MKTRRLIVGIISIAIILVSLALVLVDIFIPVKIFSHTVLNLVLFMPTGFGLLCFVLALIDKSPWYFFLSAVLLGVALFYLLLHYIFWWLSLIFAVLLISIIANLSIIFVGYKTEDIALNKSPDYKDYKQRKEEKLMAEKEEKVEELPEIKSFK